MAEVQPIWGGYPVGPDYPLNNQEILDEAYDALEKGGCKKIDTATAYPLSEESLGKFGAPKRFIIDTKTPGGFVPGHATKEGVIKDAENSSAKLGIKQVDVYYIHAPDTNVPFEETLEGINEVYKRGFFKRFGISNFQPEQIQEIYDIAKAKGYPLPTVYQGNYSAVARHLETDIFPLLRKLNISFNAYSPIAGGLLTKTKEDVLNGVGRFGNKGHIGTLYSSLYHKPAYLDALEEWGSIAEDEGIPRVELAYRWIKYHSALKGEHGDGLVFGAQKPAQITDTLANLKKGPLSDKAAARIDKIWARVKDDAPHDNFHS